MLEIVVPGFHHWVGSDTGDITWWQMTLRGAILFLWGLVLIRLGARRAFGRNTAFDIVLAVVIGSNISRAITANAPFFPTVIATTALVLLHSLLTHVSCHSRLFGRVVKGREKRLVINGRLDRAAMLRSGITEEDLREAARLKGAPDLDQVAEAYIERSGDISIIRKA